MFRVFIFITMFWICVFTESSLDGFKESNTFVEKKKRSTPRGYYGGLAYPYLPFAEPLTILAGLAFLAYVIQAFHVVFYHHGLGGGLLGGVLPPKRRSLFQKARNRSKRMKHRD